MCESFFATLECELLDRRRFASQAEARVACFSFIEGWYNRNRCEWATSRQWLVMADTVALATGRAVQWIAAGIKAAIKAGIKVSPIAGSR
jgi:hypothetical protein